MQLHSTLTKRRYENRTSYVAAAVAEQVTTADHLKREHKRGERLGLSEQELTFKEIGPQAR